jgi:hypothetical protein
MDVSRKPLLSLGLIVFGYILGVIFVSPVAVDMT